MPASDAEHRGGPLGRAALGLKIRSRVGLSHVAHVDHRGASQGSESFAGDGLQLVRRGEDEDETSELGVDQALGQYEGGVERRLRQLLG